MGYLFLLVVALFFVALWSYLARRPGPRAKVGPDGTNVRNPETFVVHHEGKGQGLDIANTALKERTEELSRDLPGDAHKIKAPAPGRDMVRMDAPPSDVSEYGEQKVAPGAVPGAPGAEPKAKVLMEGPKGSRPETPEEPGSPDAKGRRVTDIHRDVELAAETLPAAFEGQGRHVDRRQAVSPSTTEMEPGYGLGRTRPGETDGEGGAPGRGGGAQSDPSRDRDRGPEDEEPDFPVEQPDMEDDLTDIPNGVMPTHRQVTFQPDLELGDEIAFQPDPQADWANLDDIDDLPPGYGEDEVAAIVRNPRSLYIYWERAGEGETRLREMLGEERYGQSVLCLRIFDTGGIGARTVDISPHDDHWFLNDLEPGHTYVVSLERRTPDDRYYLLSLSDPVRLPHESPAAPEGSSPLYKQLEHVGKNGVDSSPWR